LKKKETSRECFVSEEGKITKTAKPGGEWEVVKHLWAKSRQLCMITKTLFLVSPSILKTFAFVYLLLFTMPISFSVLLLALFVSCYQLSWEIVLKDPQITIFAFLYFFEAAG